MINILVIIGVMLLIVGCFALEGAICMWLWNWVIVSLFAVEPITFWIGCGIVFLINFTYGLFH